MTIVTTIKVRPITDHPIRRTTLDKNTLANVEEHATLHPESFLIDSREERESLEVGNYAKLIFEGEDGAGERMWLQVTDRTRDESGTLRYHGKLASNPVVCRSLEFGEGLIFGPEHVAQTD